MKQQTVWSVERQRSFTWGLTAGFLTHKTPPKDQLIFWRSSLIDETFTSDYNSLTASSTVLSPARTSNSLRMVLSFLSTEINVRATS